MHAASAASGAAGDADSEKSNKLVSEKVNKSCTRKLLKKLCCANPKCSVNDIDQRVKAAARSDAALHGLISVSGGRMVRRGRAHS